MQLENCHLLSLSVFASYSPCSFKFHFWGAGTSKISFNPASLPNIDSFRLKLLSTLIFVGGESWHRFQWVCTLQPLTTHGFKNSSNNQRSKNNDISSWCSNVGVLYDLNHVICIQGNISRSVVWKCLQKPALNIIF